jgi:hypothetical protein
MHATGPTTSRSAQAGSSSRTLRFGIQKASEELDNLSGRPMQLASICAAGPAALLWTMRAREKAFKQGIMMHTTRA